MRIIDYKDWYKQGIELFGEGVKHWLFKCPACGNTQSIDDFLEAGLSLEEAQGRFYFSCIGRYDKTQGCDYTNGGLINIAPTKVVKGEDEFTVFEFATKPNKVLNTKFLR